MIYLKKIKINKLNNNIVILKFKTQSKKYTLLSPVSSLVSSREVARNTISLEGLLISAFQLVNP